jgi:hypothetical protein
VRITEAQALDDKVFTIVLSVVANARNSNRLRTSIGFAAPVTGYKLDANRVTARIQGCGKQPKPAAQPDYDTPDPRGVERWRDYDH